MAESNGGAVKVKATENELPAIPSLLQWDPFGFTSRPSLRSLFDWPTLFSTASAAAGDFSFAVDLKQKDGKYVAECSLPGFKTADIDVQVRGNTVTVSAESETESKEERDNYVYRERRRGSYSRTIAFPNQLDPKKVEATYTNGILKITAPAPAEPKSEKVEIKG